MTSVRELVKSKKRFINLKKEAVSEGLKELWIPFLPVSLQERMLKEFPLIQDIDDDGNIILEPKRHENNLSVGNKIDPISYGTMGFRKTSSNKVKVSKSKPKLKNVEPDPDTATKIAPYVEWYKKHYDHIVELEEYKWRATKTFQNLFDINSPDLYNNIKMALKDETNLLSGGSYNFSKDVLLKNIKYSPEEVRFLLRNLFDEKELLSKRVPEFIDGFKTLHQENQKKGNIKENEKPNQNPHAISVYLSFMYPNKHYIFKHTVWYNAIEEMGLNLRKLSEYEDKLTAYNQYCDNIRKVLLLDIELVEKHDKAYPDDLSNYHLLTQDFLYAISEHFQGLNEPSRH